MKKRFLYIAIKYDTWKKRENHSLIKIGITNDPQQREISLSRTKTTEKAKIIILWDCGDRARNMESFWHQEYDYMRVDGEWFTNVEGTIQHIGKIMNAAFGQYDPNAVLKIASDPVIAPILEVEKPKKVIAKSIVTDLFDINGEINIVAGNGMVFKSTNAEDIQLAVSNKGWETFKPSLQIREGWWIIIEPNVKVVAKAKKTGEMLYVAVGKYTKKHRAKGLWSTEQPYLGNYGMTQMQLIPYHLVKDQLPKFKNGELNRTLDKAIVIKNITLKF